MDTNGDQGYVPSDSDINDIDTSQIIEGMSKQGINLSGSYGEPVKNEYIRELVNAGNDPARKKIFGFIPMNANLNAADVAILTSRFKSYNYLALTAKKKFYQLKESDSDEYVADEIIFKAVMSMGRGSMQRGLLFNTNLVGKYERDNENLPFHKKGLKIGSRKLK